MFFLIKAVVSSVAFWLLSRLIIAKWNVIQLQFSSLNFAFFYTLLIVVLLMPVNWALEIFKWKYLISGDAQVTFGKAMREVLAGLSLNFIIPFTMGDIMARTMQYSHKKAAGISVLIARASSIGITIYFGTIAVITWLYVRQVGTEPAGDHVQYVLLICTALLISLISVLKRSRQIIMMFSIARYFIFSIQFLLLLIYFIPDLPFWMYWTACGWVFLARSVVPSFFGALGIRELSAVAFFSIFISDPEIAIIPGIILWFINVVVPSLFGLWAIFQLKLNSGSPSLLKFK